MAHAETASFTVHPLGASLGAEIRGLDLNEPLTPEQVRDLQAAWTEHLVLRFRDQQALTLESQIAFSRHFGKLDKRPTVSHEMSRQHDELPAEITVISNVKVDNKPLGALGDGEAVWHSDMTYNEHPPRGACLHAQSIPPEGGNTYFANLYAAYETLDPAIKERIATLKCVHDASRNSAGELRLGFQDNTDPRADGRSRAPARGQARRDRAPSPDAGPPAQGVYPGTVAAGKRGAAGPAVGARHPAPVHVDAGLAGRRPADVGQRGDAAPSRFVRSAIAPPDVPHADRVGLNLFLHRNPPC